MTDHNRPPQVNELTVTGAEVHDALMVLHSNTIDKIVSAQEAGELPATFAERQLAISEVVGASIMSIGSAVESGDELLGMLHGRAQSLSKPPHRDEGNRYSGEARRGASIKLGELVRQTPEDIVGAAEKIRQEQIKKAATATAAHKFGSWPKLTPPSTPAETAPERSAQNYQQPTGETENTDATAEIRKRHAERFIALAGNTISTYSDGPNTGLRAHGPNRQDALKYRHTNSELAALPAVQEAAKSDNPADVVVEFVTFTPEQENVQVDLPRKSMKPKGIFRTLQEVEEIVPTPVEVDARDPQTGERLVRVGYSFNPGLSGNENNSYRKAENDGTIPRYKEVNGSRSGVSLNYGMTLPESAAKELENLFAQDPKLAREIAHGIYTGDNTPFSEEDYYRGVGGKNPIAPPYDALPKPWKMHLFNALNQTRDRDNLNNLPANTFGLNDLSIVRKQSMRSQSHPVQIRTVDMR